MAIELLDALLRNVAIAAVAWLPTRPAEHLSDVGLAVAPVVAGVAVNDKALAVGPWPYRQRAIAPIERENYWIGFRAVASLGPERRY